VGFGPARIFILCFSERSEWNGFFFLSFNPLVYQEKDDMINAEFSQKKNKA